MAASILTREEIQAVAPAVYAPAPSGKMSDRYNFIDTANVLEALKDRGFFPVAARQDNPLRRDPLHVRHVVTMRRREDLERPLILDEAIPQVMVVNSHNGRTKMRLYTGLYRLVCTNGLIVGRDSFRSEIAHNSEVALHIEDYVEGFSTYAEQISSVVDHWSKIELSRAEALAFAEAALRERFGNSAGAYKADDVLEAHRTEDDGGTLWQVFNRVQEATVKGGLRGVNANSRRVSSRALTGIGQDLEYNQQLWRLAEDFAQVA